MRWIGSNHLSTDKNVIDVEQKDTTGIDVHVDSNGIFRDSSGGFKGSFAVYTDVKTTLHAELLVVMEAIEIYFKKGQCCILLRCVENTQRVRMYCCLRSSCRLARRSGLM